VVDAFLAASRGGDFDALLALLDPDVVLRADKAAVLTGGIAAELRGAAAVAETFAGRARAAQPALVDGAVGLAWAPGGNPKAVFDLTIADGRIVAVDLILDPDVLGDLDVVLLDG
jgi:RNA polymerase sigma-70 factor (ECF subfamily)